jgi:hypothetical protein
MGICYKCAHTFYITHVFMRRKTTNTLTAQIFDVLSYNFQTLEMYSENYEKKYGHTARKMVVARAVALCRLK